MQVKTTINPAAFKKNDSMATNNRSMATVVRRLATKQMPRNRANSPAAVDAGFVEICNLQLPQSMLKAARLIVHGRLTLRPTSSTNGRLYAPRNVKYSFSKGQKRSRCSITSREVNEARHHDACSRPCFEIYIKLNIISPALLQHGDRDQLETA